jgi:excinuclease ABC subunit C
VNETNKNIAISEKLKNLPATPGVYQFKDSSGKVIYVGKANILRHRVRQYFSGKPVSGMLDAMIKKISGIEVISTDSEVEALILEQNLIKTIKPRYNVNLKDDKSYPYIVITNEPFPRVFPTRKKRSDGSRYFGPYTDVKTMRFALKTVRNIFKIRSCNLNLTEESIEKGKFDVCLDYHIHKCEGPCVGYVLREDYNQMIDHVAKLLIGKTSTLINDLKEQMEYYASNMEFEKAAQLRDRIDAVEVYSSRQKMVGEEIIDRDIFAFAREDNDGVGMVLKIRDGKVIGKQNFFINNVLEKTDNEILENLIMNYYSKAEFIPEEIFIPEADGNELESIETIEKYLSGKKSGKVEMITPKIGEKAKLVSMVRRNAKLVLDEMKLTKMKNQFIPPSVESLKRDLRLNKLPRTIECFDISHIQGTDTVASLVVFHDSKPKKSSYRKYRLRNNLDEVGKPDDFLSMREVIYRRYKKFAEKNFDNIVDESEEAEKLPDLIIIDGGKGQLSSAVKVLEDIGIKTGSEGQNIIGLAKKLEEVFLPGDSEPQNIPKTSSGLKLLQRVRDEAHRFAITYHRKLRDKRTFKSELEEIPGVGSKTAQKLLTEFGSVEKILDMIKNNFELFAHTAGKSVANKIKEFFKEH